MVLRAIALYPSALKVRALPGRIACVLLAAVVIPAAAGLACGDDAGASLERRILVEVVERDGGARLAGVAVQLSLGDGAGALEAGLGLKPVRTDRKGQAAFDCVWYSGSRVWSATANHPSYYGVRQAVPASGRLVLELESTGTLRPVSVYVRSGGMQHLLAGPGLRPPPALPRGGLLKLSVRSEGGGTWDATYVLPLPREHAPAAPVGVLDGTLVLDGMGPVSARVEVGSQPDAPRLVFPEPTPARDVIEGTVRDAATDQALGGVRVWVPTWRTHEMLSAEDGTFRLAGIERSAFFQGLVPVLCTHRGYYFPSVGVRPDDWDPVHRLARVEIRGYPSGPGFECRLTTRTGEGARRAKVVAEVSGAFHLWVADESGIVRLPSWLAGIGRPLVAFDERSVGLVDPRRGRLDRPFVLDPIFPLHARTIVESPQPVGDAPEVFVSLLASAGEEVPLWPLHVSASGTVNGPVPDTRRATLSFGTMSRWPLRYIASGLHRASPVLRLGLDRRATACTGTLRDHEGRPLTGVRLVFKIVAPETTAPLVPEEYAVDTDSLGNFCFSGPRGPYRVACPGEEDSEVVGPDPVLYFTPGGSIDLVLQGLTGR